MGILLFFFMQFLNLRIYLTKNHVKTVDLSLLLVNVIEVSDKRQNIFLHFFSMFII